jgi:hypothetical protein
MGRSQSIFFASDKATPLLDSEVFVSYQLGSRAKRFPYPANPGTYASRFREGDLNPEALNSIAIIELILMGVVVV